MWQSRTSKPGPPHPDTSELRALREVTVAPSGTTLVQWECPSRTRVSGYLELVLAQRHTERRGGKAFATLQAGSFHITRANINEIQGEKLLMLSFLK